MLSIAMALLNVEHVGVPDELSISVVKTERVPDLETLEVAHWWDQIIAMITSLTFKDSFKDSLGACCTVL